jgi:hypothetical protein
LKFEILNLRSKRNPHAEPSAKIPERVQKLPRAKVLLRRGSVVLLMTLLVCGVVGHVVRDRKIVFALIM